MMKSAWLPASACALALIVACMPAHARPSEPIAGERVVVKRATWFHAAPGSTLRWRDEARVGEDAYWTLDLVGVEGDWLAVEADEDGALDGTGSCHRTPRGLLGFGVRLWIHRKGIAPVTRETVTVAHRDGTSARIDPGVALVAARRGTYVTDAGDLAVSFTPAEGEIGMSFAKRPRARFGGGVNARTGDRRGVARGGRLSLAGRTLVAPSWLEVTRQTPHTHGTLLDVTGRCTSFRLLARHAAGRDVALVPRARKAVLMALATGPRWRGEVWFRAARGARVYWPDGSAAGVLPVQATFALASERAQQVCTRSNFDRGSSKQDATPLEVCFAKTDVRITDGELGVDAPEGGALDVDAFQPDAP